MNVAVHHASSRLFVTNEGAARASVFDLSSSQLIAELPTGLEPDGIAITDDGKTLFVASENAGLVHVFDGATYMHKKKSSKQTSARAGLHSSRTSSGFHLKWVVGSRSSISKHAKN